MNNRIVFSLKAIAVLVAFVCLALLAQGGAITTELLQRFQAQNLEGLTEKLLPMGVNVLVGLLFLSISYLFYKPAKNGLQKTLDTAGASTRVKVLLMRSLQAGYWLITVLVVASVVAPEVLSKLFLGVSLISAALALALKDSASDLINGLLLQFSKRFAIGDKISMGSDINGTVEDIGYFSTKVKTEKGIANIPNRKIWGETVTVNDPPKSLIILPEGYEPDKDKS